MLGGNTDYGDAVYAIASGFIHTAKDFGGGWGKVMRISHHYELNGDTLFVESLYAHLNTFERNEGQCVNKGDLIGTIGDAGGQYYAHLHFELRVKPGMPLGAGYGKDKSGYLNPSEFISRFKK